MDPVQDSCGCYSVSSVLPGCAELWNSGETFTCTVTYPELGTLTGTIAKGTGGTPFDNPCSHACPLPLTQLLSCSYPRLERETGATCGTAQKGREGKGRGSLLFFSAL